MAVLLFILFFGEKNRQEKRIKSNVTLLWHFMTFLRSNIWKASCDSDSPVDKAADCIHYPPKYASAKSTTLILKSLCSVFPLWPWREKEKPHLFWRCILSIVHHTHCKTTVPKKGTCIMGKEKSSCTTSSNCRSWIDLIIKWLLCMN